MTTKSSAEELELAIKDQQQWCHCKGIVCHGCESIVGKMFKAGANWQSARDQQTIEGLRSALKYYADLKKTVFEPCNGSHVMYSSMHPLADVSCKICGQSEDGLGGYIRKEIPDPMGNKARAALKENE